MRHEEWQFQVPGSRLKGNGKGNGVNRKGREERKERRSFFFSRKQPLPSLALLASFAVPCLCLSPFIPHSAFRTPHWI
jgi:hypothetical protein